MLAIEGYLSVGGADRPAHKTDQLGQLVSGVIKQSEISATLMARLEVLDLASKESSPVPRYREVERLVQWNSEVVGQPHKMPGEIHV